MKPTLVSYFIAILSMFLYASCQSQEPIKRMDPSAFEKELKTNGSVQLLDVRTLEEYNAGHIKNCILGDINDPASYQKAITVLDKTKPVYVYCLSGGRSHRAAQDLLARGFTAIYELDGGMNAWRRNALPEEKSSNSVQADAGKFKASIKSTGTNLICVQSKYCGPCVKMKPVIESLVTEFPKVNVLKVDGGVDQAIMKEFNVSEIPAFIVIKNGKETFRKTGIVDKKLLADALK